ncbi:MAG: dTDP-4-dehydrorhamnose reductase [Planctomycetota bacterium]|nr:dTDP-4-dehydrorhamnose reductase [Planctomycetota bacterium]
MPDTRGTADPSRATSAILGESHAIPRPILILGAGGMLGRAWRELLDRRKIAYTARTRAEVNLADPASIERGVEPGTGLVINCGAWTDVDGAEKDEHGADAANGAGVGVLARRCEKVGALLVHYSTDYVFNGHAAKPYGVDEPHEPVNAYGRTKARGERLLLDSGCPHLLIRTSWVYAPWGKNFVRTIAKFAKEKPSLKVVNDQRGRPTSAEHLAAASLGLIERGARGTFHLTDGGECTWFDFAGEIARFANPACKVDPCTTADFPRPAKRPGYSVLDLSAAERILGPMPAWQRNLADVLNRLE